MPSYLCMVEIGFNRKDNSSRGILKPLLAQVKIQGMFGLRRKGNSDSIYKIKKKSYLWIIIYITGSV